MRPLLPGLLLLGACGFQHGAAGGGGDGSAGSRDGGPDALRTDGSVCIGTGAYMVCLSPAPTTPVSLTGLGSLVTTNDPHCLATQPAGWTAASQPESCFIVGTTISLGDRLSVSGSRPLVLVATDGITIGGILDVASHRGGKVGPGAGMFTCPTPLMMPTNATQNLGGGGGAGATFVGKGGDGGKGDSNKGNRGQAAAMLPKPNVLRAGCVGQNGGDGNNLNTNHGAGAAGGGSVYLLAGGTLMITGVINASGAGAAAGGNYGGGGGGGSGGMIVISAAAITASGNVLANGGGGAGGGSMGYAGSDGADPDETNPASPPLGGTGSGPGGSDGNAGGRGYSTAGPPGPGGNSGVDDGGGGAGGGGAGYLQSDHPLAGAVVSPPVTPP